MKEGRAETKKKKEIGPLFQQCEAGRALHGSRQKSGGGLYSASDSTAWEMTKRIRTRLLRGGYDGYPLSTVR